jgi:hypothetical protein
MSVIFEKVLTLGWKHDENGRFKDVIVWRFIDSESKKILFEYAPKLSDKDFMVEVMDDVDWYDEECKALLDKVRARGLKISSRIDDKYCKSDFVCTSELVKK